MKRILFALLLFTLSACDSHDHGAGSHDEEDHGEHGEEEGHHHEAPHGGTLVVLGDELAHVELLLDAETGTLEAWVLDGSAERGVRLSGGSLVVRVEDETAFDVTLEGVASSLTGETREDTSAFRGTEERLKGRTDFAASLPSLTVKGVAFEAVSFRYPEGNEGGDHDPGHED